MNLLGCLMVLHRWEVEHGESLELGMYMVCVKVKHGGFLQENREKSGWQGGLGSKCSVGVVNGWPKERVQPSGVF